ncbi:17364_t:CDS:2 [Dentiscutata erythropus]|uniref:17364_t:CDS:1 n=1 Tax=Dentiscutata erythropus TaxID=1348616 RepID=A0A9N9P459_9GLOM|nr:17364_t:CDS:2 [Dentiscutata erythropus]
MTNVVTKKFWIFVKNTPRVTAVKVPITETAETIITAAQSRYGPEISQYPSIELTLVDSEGKIDKPFEIKIIDSEGNFVEHEDIQIFVFVKDIYDGDYYPTASIFRNQYEVDQFLGLNRFQLVDRHGKLTDTSVLTRWYKDLVQDSYYILV